LVLLAPGVTHAKRAALVRGNTQFALDLYAKVRSGQNNLFFSPFSISTALAMTYAGARGKTASQMAQTLRLGQEGQPLHRTFGALIRSAARTSSHGNTLTVANALWGQKGYRFLGTFLKTVRNRYRAGLKQLDFGDASSARKTINRWVERKTKKKIKDLIPEGVLDSMVRLVLTNAIHFKGTWQRTFKKHRTRTRPFKLHNGSSVEVPLMSQEGTFGYGETGKHQVLELPYRGKKLSMVVFLPRAADGLPALESQLSAAWIEEATSKLKQQKVVVYLPRFKLSAMLKLSDQLKALGMIDAFSRDDADFSGMSGTRDLYISRVLHKAFVDVNEKGTEAAAATAVVMRRRGRPPPRPVFRADHPFVFLIRDRTTGSVLFLGRLHNPQG
jgi:serpin B